MMLAKSRLDQTRWTCEKCNKSNIVYHEKRVGIFEMIHFIEDDHRLFSPNCGFDFYKVRVELIKDG